MQTRKQQRDDSKEAKTDFEGTLYMEDFLCVYIFIMVDEV